MLARGFRSFVVIAGGTFTGLFACALAYTIWKMPARVRGTAVIADVPRGDAGAPTRPTSSSSTVPAAQVARAERRPFNVVLVTIDTLRHDIGYAGYPRPVSPHIDAFAKKSVVYDRMYAMASFTPKSVGPMLIGRYVEETAHDPNEHYTRYFESNTFLAERVVAAGGRTMAAMCHHYFRFKTGYDQGFDVWDLSSIPADSRDNSPSVTSDVLTDTAIGMLKGPRAEDIPARSRFRTKRDPGHADGGRPQTDKFFAWFHYLDPHLPYVPHDGAPNFAAMSAKDKIPVERGPYDGEVWFTDKHVGRLLSHIAAQPWASETAIILTADHGEAFGERGHWRHGREVWEPLVRVPFVLSIPGEGARRIDAKRSHIDLVPTVLDLMGIAPPESLSGRTLLHDLHTRTPEERDVYIAMPEGPFNEMRRAFITGPSPGTKLVEFPNGKHELFDLAADPAEAKSLTADKARLRATVDAFTAFRGRLHERKP